MSSVSNGISKGTGLSYPGAPESLQERKQNIHLIKIQIAIRVMKGLPTTGCENP